MQEWIHDGMTYQVNSMYSLPDDAWIYELTGPCPRSGGAAWFAVVIPDATPNGEFRPRDAAHAYVMFSGSLPWLVLQRFIRFVEASGDIVPGTPALAATGDLSLSLNTWRFANRVFEVNSFHDGEHDGWCHEIYEVNPGIASNDYIDVRIPDLQPAGGHFVPTAARHVVVAGHGDPRQPWLVFRHFIDSLLASGDIVEDPG